MNTRDYMTSVWLDLENIQSKLEDIQNNEDFEEAIANSSELASEVHSICESINEHFNLKMEEV